MDLSFRAVGHGSREYEETVALRDAILRKPLGLHFTPEQLGSESSDIHLGCYAGEELVGCMIMTMRENGEARMRQVAVAAELQGKGIGHRMVQEFERRARELGARLVTLHARASAVPFYESLGYECIDEPFVEVTIAHRKMFKRLDS